MSDTPDLTPIRKLLDDLVAAGPVRVGLSARRPDGDTGPVSRLIKDGPLFIDVLLAEVERLQEAPEAQPPPADAALLASANRELCERLGQAERERDAALAEVARLRDDIDDILDVLREHAEDCTQQPAHLARPGRVGACCWCELLTRITRAHLTPEDPDHA